MFGNMKLKGLDPAMTVDYKTKIQLSERKKINMFKTHGNSGSLTVFESGLAREFYSLGLATFSDKFKSKSELYFHLVKK